MSSLITQFQIPRFRSFRPQPWRPGGLLVSPAGCSHNLTEAEAHNGLLVWCWCTVVDPSVPHGLTTWAIARLADSPSPMWHRHRASRDIRSTRACTTHCRGTGQTAAGLRALCFAPSVDLGSMRPSSYHRTDSLAINPPSIVDLAMSPIPISTKHTRPNTKRRPTRPGLGGRVNPQP